MAPVLRPVSSVANVRAADCQDEQYDLGEEPRPAAALPVSLLANLSTVLLARRRAAAGAGRAVQGLGSHGDDVVVVAELTRLGGETKVSNVGDRGGRVQVKALLPLVLVLILELELELLVLEIGEAQLGGRS